jgi:hypothetical protein
MRRDTIPLRKLIARVHVFEMMMANVFRDTDINYG